MRTHKKTIYGVEVSAYNDSNSEWVVSTAGSANQRFNKRKWTMANAMELVARINTPKKIIEHNDT